MKQSSSTILIVSYYFPPNPVVGSRRWAKYGKVLQENGVDVHVIAAKTNAEKSPWDEDMKGLNVDYVPGGYPAALDDWGEKSIWQKLKYKWADKMVKTRVTGMPYDRSVFWGNALKKKLRAKIISDKISHVIVSTPPHRSAFFVASLKEEFPHVQFMVDFRDPWTWGSFREYPYLKGTNRRREEEMEKFVITKMDRIIVPVEKMLQSLPEHDAATNEKLYWLPAAFDQDDFKKVSIQHKPVDNGPIRFIYFGSLYDNLDDHFQQIAQAIAEADRNIRFDIYSNSTAYQAIFKEHGVEEQVFYHQPLPSREIFQQVTQANYVFLFKPYEYGKDNVSTKYFEIIQSRTPIILIGEKGMASDFVLDNQLGVHAEVSAAKQLIQSLVDRTKTIEYNAGFDVRPYSFQALGKKMISDLLA